ncbi:Sapep family Mn(2+)-dependent dipeptidase [Xylocopilactobacillus apicola]|nr:Sapep family Mn(2+)-dependent dipeptidase [Xylocopilactobacillus apicola]
MEEQPKFLADLAKIIAIPSVRSEAKSHAPFGLGPRQVLSEVVQLARQYDFKYEVVNDAMAYVQWGDDNDNYFGIVGHLDVVGAGDNWTSDPFTLRQRGDYLYARGILDNKGPSIACLYALKILKDQGYLPKKTIRIIFGSDEESGSNDIPLYLAKEKAPQFGFTPDCKFPVVYGERGIVNYEIFTPINEDQVSEITGDQAPDHVPDELKIMINQESYVAKGKRSPTNAPELGVNAITVLTQQILAQDLVHGELKDYFTWLDQALRDKHYGEGLGLEFSDPASGRLIVTPYFLQKSDAGWTLKIAMRYPVTYTESQVTEQLKKAVFSGSQIKIIRSMPSVMHDPNSPEIQILSQVYEDLTKLDGTPVTTTGATYARSMPNIVAFGPSFPGQKGIAHKEDEWMKIDDLMLNLTIYLNAIFKLAIEGGE